MKAIVSIALVGVFLSGCAGHMVYSKPGASEQDFYADQSFCDERATNIARGQGGLAGIAVHMQSMQRCMAGKGYTCYYSESKQPCEK